MSRARVFPGGRSSHSQEFYWIGMSDYGQPPETSPIPVREREREKEKPKEEPAAPAGPSLHEIEAGKREAYQSGYREGVRVGRSEVEGEIERLAAAVAELATMREKIQAGVEGDLLRIAIAVARRVLHRELTLNPESMRGLVEAALRNLQGLDIHRVRVHPNHEAVLSSILGELIVGVEVRVQPDPALQPGDVIFETARGDLDASIESQLSEIEKGLAERLLS